MAAFILTPDTKPHHMSMAVIFLTMDMIFHWPVMLRFAYQQFAQSLSVSVFYF